MYIYIYLHVCVFSICSTPTLFIIFRISTGGWFLNRADWVETVSLRVMGGHLMTSSERMSLPFQYWMQMALEAWMMEAWCLALTLPWQSPRDQGALGAVYFSMYEHFQNQCHRL